MSQDEEHDSEAAETRVLADDGAASAAAATVVLAETSDVEPPARSTSEQEASAETVMALDEVVGPETGVAREQEAEAPGSGSNASGGSAGRPVADTRVLDDPDKTRPPRVVPARPDGRQEEPIGAASPAPAQAAPARPAPPPAPIDPDRGLAPGTVLFGEYEIVSVLGVGGMGEVYRAKHRRLDEHRAIKVMHAELSKKKGASEFFYREAKALLAVRHPAVVHCHDLLSDDGGRVYLIMEMIEGIPLSKKMNDGSLSPDDVATLGARVSHGLAAAHRKGVIHRDLSPDNIVLPNGRVQEAKIIDFGIAKLLEEGEGTIVDGFKGKLSYASPEQLGFHGGRIDGRSDFYSLGLVLAAAALGRPMPMGTTVVEAVDARRNFKKLPDAIPMGLASAIRPLLALDPEERPKYVDRLFVVPGGVEGAPTGGIPTGGVTRSGTAEGGDSRWGTRLAAGVAAVALVAVGIYALSATQFAANGPALAPAEGNSLAGDRGSTVPGEAGDTLSAGESPPALIGERPALAGSSEAASGGNDLAPGGVLPVDPKPVALVRPPEVERPPERRPPPAPRRITAADRAKIIGLSRKAVTALSESRLMTPRRDNAFAFYREILKIDPNHVGAKNGMRSIASRYVAMADRAIAEGDLDRARTFVDRANRADSSFDGIRAIESRLAQ